MSHQALLSKSAVSPSDVLFVDDAAENVQSVRLAYKQHMGCGHALSCSDDTQVSITCARSLGVQAVHLPQGLTQEAWSLALESYVKSRAK